MNIYFAPLLSHKKDPLPTRRQRVFFFFYYEWFAETIQTVPQSYEL